MKTRDLLTLALRVIGVWVLASTIATMSMLVAALATVGASGLDTIAGYGFAIIADAMFASALLLFAPSIAIWLDRRGWPPNAPRLETLETSLTLRDIYKVVLRCFGVYGLYMAVAPLTRLITRLWDGARLTSITGDAMARESFLQAALFLAVAALLIFQADAITSVFVRAPAEEEAKPPRSPFDEPEETSGG